MADRIMVKVQRGLARNEVMLSEHPDGFKMRVPEDRAEDIVDNFELLPLGSCYAMADVDDNGFLELNNVKVKP